MRRGFTLVELVMVILILAIVAGIGVPMLLETIDAWSFTSRFQDAAVYSAIVSNSRMSREIRRLLNDGSVSTATNSQITFTDLSSIAITFNRSGNTLMRNTDGLADNVTALTYTYYDDAGNTIVTPVVAPNDTNIRRVKADFSILAGSNTLNFEFQVRPQNLRRLSEKFK